jgi:hypothetical protein
MEATTTTNGIEDEEEDAPDQQPQTNIGDSLLAASEEPECCEAIYLGSGNCKKLLLAMCYGIKDGDRQLGVTTVDPYQSTKRKVLFIPNRDILLDEIKRRADIFDVLPRPRMASKSIVLRRKWLEENPITDLVDVAFLKREETNFRQSLQAALDEELNLSQQNRTRESASWTTCDPYLRLYHSLIDDEVVDAFISCHAVMDRPELDARNSLERPPTFEETIAKKFNNPDFEPITRAIPDLHDDFRHPITLPFSAMPGPVTPDFIANKLNDVKTKALHVSKTISEVHTDLLQKCLSPPHVFSFICNYIIDNLSMG